MLVHGMCASAWCGVHVDAQDSCKHTMARSTGFGGTHLELIIEQNLVVDFLGNDYISDPQQVNSRREIVALWTASKGLMQQPRCFALSWAYNTVREIKRRVERANKLWFVQHSVRATDHARHAVWPQGYWPGGRTYLGLQSGRIHTLADGHLNRIWCESRPGIFVEHMWCGGCNCWHIGGTLALQSIEIKLRPTRTTSPLHGRQPFTRSPSRTSDESNGEH